MSFRRRITFVSAAAVAIAVVLASLLTYVLTSNQLHSQVDAQLRHRGGESARLLQSLNDPTRQNQRTPSGNPPLGWPWAQPPRSGRDLTDKTAQRTSSETGGTATPSATSPPNPIRCAATSRSSAPAERSSCVRRSISLPVDARTRLLAANGGEPFFRNATVDGIHMRILAEPLDSGRAVQYAQPLTEVDSLLSRLRLILALLDIGGIALAALLGRLVAGAAVLPLKRLTQATEHVALTQDLSGRIEPIGDDEIGRLASSFNAMLDALEHSMSALDASVHAQRQLVADASHELRTPVTSLRTNIEILQQRRRTWSSTNAGACSPTWSSRSASSRC